jgi:hypothetical protein
MNISGKYPGYTFSLALSTFNTDHRNLHFLNLIGGIEDEGKCLCTVVTVLQNLLHVDVGGPQWITSTR